MTEEIPSGDETLTGEAEITVVADTKAETAAQGKCTKQNVLIAVLKLRYLSNRILTDQFIAESVSPSTGSPEKTDINSIF